MTTLDKYSFTSGLYCCLSPVLY